jgi:hypothetical protein
LRKKLHSQFYDLPDVDVSILDKWEDDLTSDVYGIEERVEGYIRGILKSNGQASGENKATSPQSASVSQLPEELQTSSQVSTPEANTSTLQQEEIQEIPSPTSNMNSTVETKIDPLLLIPG